MLSIDEVLGNSVTVWGVTPAPWWMNHPDAETKESRLAAWLAGRDFKIFGGPYLSINTTLTMPDRFVDRKFGFEYPRAEPGAEPVYYNPPVQRSDEREF